MLRVVKKTKRRKKSKDATGSLGPMFLEVACCSDQRQSKKVGKKKNLLYKD